MSLIADQATDRENCNLKDVFNSLCCVLSIISLNTSFKLQFYLLPDLLLNSFSFYINDYNFHLERSYLVV